MDELNWRIGLIVLGFFLVVLGMQFRALWLARRARGHCLPAGMLPEGLAASADGYRLLYFSAAGCVMCPPVTRIVRELARTRPWIHHLDAHEHLNLARACGVRGTPALVLLRGDCIERVLVGQKSREAIEALIAGVQEAAPD